MAGETVSEVVDGDHLRPTNQSAGPALVNSNLKEWEPWKNVGSYLQLYLKVNPPRRTGESYLLISMKFHGEVNPMKKGY